MTQPAHPRGQSCWMFGMKEDLLVFFAPIALGVGLVCLAQVPAIHSSILLLALTCSAFGLSQLHQGPTWFMYLDRTNRAYWNSTWQNKLTYFIMPPFVIAATVICALLWFNVTYVLTALWVLQHFVQQNVGILILYHRRDGAHAIPQRSTELLSQYSAALLFAAIFFFRTCAPDAVRPFQGMVVGGLSVLTILVASAYLKDLFMQHQRGLKMNWQALAFWVCSLLFLMPTALFARSFDESILIPAVMHWCQYMSLNWALTMRKYSTPGQSANIHSAAPGLIFAITCLALSATGIALLVVAHPPIPLNQEISAIATGLVMGLANCHNFIDSYLWRFRESHQRENLLPYLLREQNPPITQAPVSAAH